MSEHLKDIAKHLEGFGRHGDSELVHLNKIEVDWLKSMSPTGELTTNPDTGLQEAFLPLLASLFAPALGGALGIPAWLAGAGLSGIASAAMGNEGGDILKDAVLGGAGSAAGQLFRGGSSAGKVAEGMLTDAAPNAAAQGAHALPRAAAMAPTGIGGKFMGMISDHPLAAMGVGGLAGAALNGGFNQPKAATPATQDNSLPAPSVSLPTGVIPLQNPYTYGIDGGEQNFFQY